MSEFEVLVDVKVDDSKLNNLKTEIANIGGAKNPVKIVLDTSDAQTKIASLKSDIQSLGKANISLSGASKMEASLDRIANSVDSISTSLSSLGNSASSSANKASSALNNGANSARKMANEVDKIKNSFDQLTPSDKMSRLNSSFDKLSTSSEKFGHDISKATQYFHECEDAYEALENAIANNSGITAANEKWVAALKKAENQIKINKREMENMLDPLKKVEFSNEIDLWLKRNSAAAEQFGDKLDDLKRRLQTCDKVNFNNLKSEFKQIKTQAELAGKTGLKFSDQLKTQFDRLKGYMAASFGIMEVIQGFRAMYDAVLEVDTAMTELKRVTDLSATQYSDLYSDLTVSAREYGVALNDIISATADWSRAGFDASIAKGLAEVTTMYQHIADVDYDTAVENLLTAYKGFEGELKGMFGTDTVAAVSYIGDILNELDNNYSVTAAGVGEALKRSASALDVAGNSIQETAAMVTGITEVTQDPEKAGNALKVVSMRLRGMKGQLEELGEDVDDNVVNLSKMQGQVLRLTRGKVNIFDDSGEFKSTYEIMQGIADVLHELSTIEQADLLETVAGKHRANDVAALVSNWNNVEKAVVSATNATGSAAEEHAKYVDSMQGRLNQLTAAFQSFSNTFLETDMVKGVISALTGLLDTLEKIIDTIGGVGTAGLLGGLFLGFKKRGSISNFFGAISGGIKSFGDLGAAASLAKGSLVSFLKTPMGMLTGIGAVITVIGTVISLIDSYKQKQRELRQETIDTSNSFSSSFGTFEQAYIKYADKTVLTVDEENELKSAIDGTITALGNKSGALKEAAGASSEYASSLDKIAQAELVEAQRLSNDARKAAEEQLKADAGKYALFSFRNDNTVADIQLPKVNSEEYKAVQDLIESDDFQKYVGSAYGKNNWYSNAETQKWFRFDKDGGLDSLIEQYNLALELKNQLNDEASRTGNDDILDSQTYKDASDTVDTMASGIDELIQQTYNYEKANYQLKNGIATTEEEFYAMREAVLSNATASVEARVAMADLMSEEYADVFDLSSIEAQMNYIKSVTSGIKGIDFEKMNTFEMFLDMKTRVNNGECTVGDYTDYIAQANEAINSIEDAEVQEFLRVQLGLELDEDGNIEDEIQSLKDKLVRDLTNNDVSAEVAEAFADGLSAAELDAAINLIASGEIDLQNFDIDRAMREIEEEAERREAIRFTVDLELEVENLEKLNEAVTESLSGTGLGTEGMSAVTSMFSGLDSYDPSRLFERTANGIRLNTDEYRRLNNEYQKTNLDGLNKKMSALGDEYLETREELSDLTYGTEEYYAKAGELSDLEAQIHATEQLAAQYEGLASAYNEWQMAEEAGNQRDMYESVIEGLEAVKDEISRGWVDDGTVEFLELLTGKDLSSGNLKEIESAYKSLGKTIENTSYSVKDFFTVNDDGESTSEGVYNFLDAVGQLEEEAFGGLDIVKRDKDGNIISFDFRIAGGDKAIADALGISEELVGIMVRAADDAGFVVSMDGTYQQLDVLKEKAAEAAKSLKDTFKVTEHSFFQDGSAEGILNDYNEAMKVWETFKANKNADGTVNMSVEGAEEAFTLVSTLQSMVDQLNEPVYMDINANEVEKEMQTPLSKLQEYERLTQTEHQLKLKGTDTSELDASQEKILDYFEGLDPEIKAQLGIENLSREELQAKVEAGEIEIPATVDLQVEMNDTLKDMVNVALYNAGVIDKKELEARVDVSLYAEKVDTSDVENKTKDAVENAGGDDKKTETTANVDVEAGEVDISDVADKTKEAIENVSGEKTDVEKSVDLEVKIDEYNELIENLEDADKDIKIKVTVEGLDQVQELNKNIDLATEIDGDIDNLSEFVEGAKALSELDSSIATYVTAEVNGNVIETPEYMINNLKTFAESAQGLKDVGSPTSNVTANVDGNVVNTWEEGLDNLKVFSDSAKDVKNIGNVSSSVDANISGNVTGMLEESIDNLKTYSESAKDVDSIGDVTSSVNASIHGNVTGMLEESIDNLKAYSDSAVNVADIGEVTSSVNASIHGNVTGMLEESIDNLKAYSDSAAEVESIGEVTSSVNASIHGNVTGMLEESIDNLKTYSESASEVADIGEVTSSVNASIHGNVTGMLEESIDNLKAYSDSASEVASIGDVSSSVNATVHGNVTGMLEESIDNLKVYSDSAAEISSIGDVSSSVNANVDGNVTGMMEESIKNLKTYSDSAKDVASIGDVSSSVDVSIRGNVTGMLEESIDNLKTYSDSAYEVADIGDVSSSVNASIHGNVTGMLEESIDNLKAYSDSAKDVSSIGDVTSSVDARISGNVTGMLEESIDNLKAYSDSAKDVASIGDVTSSVNATISGNVTGMLEESIDNLKAYSESARDVASIGEVTSSVNASVNGNVTGMLEESIDNLKVYSDSAKNVASVGEVTSSVSANVSGNIVSKSEESIDNIGVFAENANKLKGVGSPTSTATANVAGNATADKISTLKDFNGIASALKSIGSVVVSVTANIAADAINGAIDLLSRVASSGVFKDYNANVNVTAKVSSVDDTAVQNYQVPPKDGKATYTVDSSQVDSWTAPPKTGTITYSPVVKALTDLQKNKTGTIRYTPIIGGVATGTAFAGGSSSHGVSGRAFARGDWGIKGSGVALAGELGQELVVRDGHFFTVGDQGAEFFKYQPNDIVFNAAQTESLFRYGGIKGAKPRGTMLASGTAFAGGSLPSSGKAFPQSSTGSINGSPVSTWNDSSSSSSSSKSSKSKSSSSSDASKDAEEFKEKLDWIEIAIDRIERAISRLDLKASSIFKKWGTRNSALVDQIGKVREEIDLQERAYNRYMQEANSVGLSSSYAAKVRNGEINIEEITDEDLKEKIDEYQEWYEKALDCKDAIDELNETVSELYAQKFDNIITEFEGIIAVAEHEKNMLEEAISQSEAKGRITSTSYYDALIAYEKENQDTLIDQREKMMAQLNENVASGAIKEGSEEWYREIEAINDVTLAIEESNTALLDYAKTIRELEWEQFEALQDRISHITEESEFLIDLMSNDKLYDDKGQLTNEGIATVGLHGVNYNTYMHQADMYGKQAEEAYAAWQADPTNKELEDYYYEMLELQREHILLAEDEVDAYKDIVEEGIELELDALQELIDKKNEALQSEKDAYEYSKKVAEQTKEIADLEKQMAAYSGDNSEETKAKIQELKVSLEEAKTDLEETEYDKYISDQEALLDELYLEYETILNQRLDNVDLLLQSMIDTTNANAATINETLSGVANGVGTEMSDVMGGIFGTEGENNVANVITAYDKNFGTTMTGVKGAIDGIKEYTDMLKKKADDEAAAKAAKAKESNAAKSKEASGSANTSGSSNNNNKNNNNKNTTSGDGKPKIGDKVKFVSGKYYYDSQGKSPLGSKYQGKEVYITNINEKSWATHPYHISTGKKLGSGDLGWLKLNQISGYATGKKNFLSDEVAWTQEAGREFIIRPSDGAILTPLAKGDSVLNAAASSNLWNMANSPAEFIRDSLGIGNIGAPVGSGAQTSVEQNFENVNFVMPNVKNYDEMLAQMRRDPNFQRLIDAMGVDQIAGKSSLRKGKAIR